MEPTPALGRPSLRDKVKQWRQVYHFLRNGGGAVFARNRRWKWDPFEHAGLVNPSRMAAAEAQKAATEAQKAVAGAQKGATRPLRLTGWGTIALAIATFILALLTACNGPLATACSRLGQLLAKMIAITGCLLRRRHVPVNCRSAWARSIAAASPRIGSSSKIRMQQP